MKKTKLMMIEPTSLRLFVWSFSPPRHRNFTVLTRAAEALMCSVMKHINKFLSAVSAAKHQTLKVLCMDVLTAIMFSTIVSFQPLNHRITCWHIFFLFSSDFIPETNTTV